ncbi:hypothetical protein [Nitratireductor sp. L15S-10]
MPSASATPGVSTMPGVNASDHQQCKDLPTFTNVISRSNGTEGLKRDG